MHHPAMQGEAGGSCNCRSNDCSTIGNTSQLLTAADDQSDHSTGDADDDSHFQMLPDAMSAKCQKQTLVLSYCGAPSTI